MSKPRPPRRVTPTFLENVALHYLERFAASAQSLRRVLMRRVERAARVHGDDPAEGEKLVAALIERYQRAGLLDDQRYAELKIRSLHRRGRSLQAIQGYLAERGVDPQTVGAAIADLREGAAAGQDPDREAAMAYARRRRLGPYRPAELRAEHRQRDLAALGRAGFSWQVAVAVVDAESQALPVGNDEGQGLQTW